MHRPDQELVGAFHAIEQAIVEFYTEEPGLLDAEVRDALYALWRHYAARARNEGCGRPRLDGRASGMYQLLAHVCEVVLDARVARGTGPDAEPYSVDDIVRCLKRTRESVELWSRQRGRQGYLDYVSEFIAGIPE